MRSNRQKTARITLKADSDQGTISRHIYGHFSEHLGHCIYGGLWVGEDSDIPNTRGIRNDVVEALKKIRIPNLRWPGGCFADEYHWKDGIGPRKKRPTMINTHWGGVTEDNSFGTHEFLDLCEQLGTEPVIVGNVGSGTVDEMSKWVEYINFDGRSPMTDLRTEHAREKPWNVKYWGVGNESWGCGGNMKPEYYADLYRRYATFARNYGNNTLRKIAAGANVDDYRWTEVLMKNVPHHMMWGLSLHHYTTDWHNKGPATGFDESQYIDTIDRCIKIEKVIDKHIAIMDEHDPEKKVAMVVDEWGTWFDVEPESNPGFLFQQNTLRDAFVAGISLNYFNAKCDRIQMANIAQLVNVLQAPILTEGKKMVLTPTYHVFDMYKVHQDASLLPLELKCDTYAHDQAKLPAISASASRDGRGAIHLSLVNIHPRLDADLTLGIEGANPTEVSGTVLTAGALSDHNTFDAPERVVPAPFTGAKIDGGKLETTLPAKSVVVLRFNEG